MTSENSLFHKFMVLQSDITKRRRWVVLLAFVTYLLYDMGAMALFLSEKMENQKVRIDRAAEILGAYSPNGVITIVGSVLLAVEGFSWLMNRQKLDFYESQPVSRNAHFFGVVINSTFILLLSHLAGTLGGIAVAAARRSMTAGVASSAFGAVLRDLCLYAAVFSMSMLAVMLTGNIIVSVIAAAVILVYEKV
ncbi:MAG: hypothetical protein ACI4CS_09210, partial [Candidatus Weimeria sp.]